MVNPLLKIENGSKVIQKTTLFKEVNFTLNAGESAGIFGPSGCGKTTLLQILGCLQGLTEGSLYIKNQKIDLAKGLDHRRHTFGFIFQNFQLLDRESAIENVLLPVKINRLFENNRTFYQKKAAELLEFVGLASIQSQDVQFLSGGEKQRIAIARALIHEPLCVLADEPTGSLDESNKQLILDLLLNLVRNYQTALVMVSHDLSFISQFDHVYQLKNWHLTKGF